MDGASDARAEWRWRSGVGDQRLHLIGDSLARWLFRLDSVVGGVPGADAVRGLQRYMMMRRLLAALLAMAVDRLRVGGGPRALLAAVQRCYWRWP